MRLVRVVFKQCLVLGFLPQAFGLRGRREDMSCSALAGWGDWFLLAPPLREGNDAAVAEGDFDEPPPFKITALDDLQNFHHCPRWCKLKPTYLHTGIPSCGKPPRSSTAPDT